MPSAYDTEARGKGFCVVDATSRKAVGPVRWCRRAALVAAKDVTKTEVTDDVR